MAGLSTFLKVGSAFAMMTGAGDVLFGISMLQAISGIPFPENSPAMPLADSQIRYLGGVWAGYGMMLWWASNDLRARQTPLAILGGTMFLGGIGRGISAAAHGFRSPMIVAFTAIELVVPPAIWLLGSW